MISFSPQKQTIFLWISLFFLALLPNGHGEPRLADERNSIEVYKRSNTAVVNITSVTLKRDWFFEIQPQQGVGSGAIVRKDGYIVTNDHVLGGAYQVRVTLSDKSEYPAKVVGRDPDTDLAVIKIEPKGKKLSPLKFGKGTKLSVGQKVLAIGNPFSLGGSLTVGVISALARDIRATTGRTISGVIQTDAAINPGNSGGPLIDSSGRLIGINAQIFSPSGGNVGLGFAISVDTVKAVVNQLIQYGQVLRPYLGMEGIGLGPALLRHFKVPSNFGVMIIDSDRRGPVSRAGLRAANRFLVWGFREIPVGGDIIYQVDNLPVSTYREIQDYVFDKKIGDTVTFHYLRNRKRRKANIKLALPPGVREKSM